jgi:ubiquinone/menaquinone biosynthesis C-methylase UbiE
MTGPSYKNAQVCSMILDGPQRYQWQDPDKIIDALICSPDLTVADLGAGTGFFTALFSRALPEGKVIALEPEAALLEWLEQRKADEGMDNVAVYAIGLDTPGLELIDGGIDLLFVGYTYFHFDDPVPYFREKVRPFLHDKARLAIADVEPEFAGAMRKKVSSAQVIEEMKEAGFILESAPELAENQYLLIFKK